MRKLVALMFLPFMACNVGSSNDDRPIDEQHRPSDYVNQMRLILSADTSTNEVEIHHVLSYESDKDFEGFLDQVWQMAFSGEAIVHGVDFIGEIDQSSRLDPKSLVEMLSTSDTMLVEDLATGELLDSVVKMTFDKSAVSAITIYFIPTVQNQSLELEAYSIGVGEQVFDVNTGRYRGVANRFYLLNKNISFDLEEHASQRLCLRSDSLGLLKPSYIEGYLSQESHRFEPMIRETSHNDSALIFETSVELNFSVQSIFMKVPEVNKPT